jgi:hypothetical protein
MMGLQQCRPKLCLRKTDRGHKQTLLAIQLEHGEEASRTAHTVRRLPELRRRTQVKVASTVGKNGGEVLHNRVWNHTQACLFATLLGHETLCSIRKDKHSSLEIGNSKGGNTAMPA